MKKMYLIMKSVGDSYDHYDYPMGVCEDEDFAKEFIKKLEEERDRTLSLAIKDSYDDFGNPSSSSFSQLITKYQEDLFPRILPNFKDLYSLKEEDYDIINSINEEETLREYMKNNNYSDDVIEATIEYNYLMGREYIDCTFYYESVPLIEKK